MKKEIEIGTAFNGPPNCGQGGYVSGLLAKEHGSTTCETSLKLPTPLAKVLSITSNGDKTDLFSGDKLLVSAGDGVLNLEIPECPTTDKTEAASANYRGHNSKAIFDTCFVCGTARHDHAAMRIFAGPVDHADAEGLHAAHWTPDAAHGGDKGQVQSEFIWSALDCPGYFAGCEDGQLALLGRMTTTITGALNVGERATVIGWPITSTGRKAITGTAIYNENNDIVACAEGLWIHIDHNPFAS